MKRVNFHPLFLSPLVSFFFLSLKYWLFLIHYYKNSPPHFKIRDPRLFFNTLFYFLTVTQCHVHWSLRNQTWNLQYSIYEACIRMDLQLKPPANLRGGLYESLRLDRNPARRAQKQVKNSAISFPEPTCLLVSTKTRSSGIINFQRPRF